MTLSNDTFPWKTLGICGALIMATLTAGCTNKFETVELPNGDLAHCYSVPLNTLVNAGCLIEAKQVEGVDKVVIGDVKQNPVTVLGAAAVRAAGTIGAGVAIGAAYPSNFNLKVK